MVAFKTEETGTTSPLCPVQLGRGIVRALSAQGLAAGGWANAAAGLRSPCLCSEHHSGVFPPP